MTLSLAVALVFSAKMESVDTICTPDEATIDEATPTGVVPTTMTATVATREVEVPTKETQAPTVSDETEIVQEVYEIPEEETYVDEYEDYEEDESEEETEVEHVKSSASSEYRDVVAAIAYLEAGNCSEYCQWLVASALLNLADHYGMSVEAVATTPSMFSVAYSVYSCYPSDLSYDVADRVLSGDRDYNVMAFQTGGYHSFGTPYAYVDGVYFSEY